MLKQTDSLYNELISTIKNEFYKEFKNDDVYLRFLSRLVSDSLNGLIEKKDTFMANLNYGQAYVSISTNDMWASLYYADTNGKTYRIGVRIS